MRMLKFGFNLIDDGLVGQQVLQVKQQGLLMEHQRLRKEELHFLKKERKNLISFPGTSKKHKSKNLHRLKIRQMKMFKALNFKI